jgi:endonuclease/exonuclease/phosphatase (EEP) superfamily protein YafD
MSRNRAEKDLMETGRSGRMFGLATVLTSLAAAFMLAAGFLAEFHPAFDSLAHFRIHLAAVLIVAAILLIPIRGFRWPGLAAAAFGIWALVSVTGLSVVPGLGPVQASHEPDDELGPVYRLLQLNLRFDNAEAGKVLSLIGRVRPDVITLDEVSDLWREKVSLLSSAYPHQIVCQVPHVTGGVAILSLRPFAEGSEPKCLAGGALATATVDFGGRFVDVAAIHLHWPWPRGQARQIEKMRPLLGGLADNAILAGDLNATPWSAASSHVAQASATEPVGPSGPTWLHRWLPEWLRFAGLPIDHVFTKGEVIAHSVETLEPVGSDHLPVLMEFSLDIKPVEPDAKTATAWLTPAG